MVPEESPSPTEGATSGSSPRLSVSPAPPGGGLRSRVRRVAGVVGVAGLAAWVTAPRFPTRGVSRSDVLVGELAKRGIKGKAEDVVWIDTPTTLRRSLRKARAVVRASPAPAAQVRGGPVLAADEEEAADLFLVEAKLSPEGVLLDVGSVFNLTETSAADEGRPIAAGERVAYVAEPLVQGARPTVGVLDLRGRSRPFGDDWTRLERTQQSLSNWQATGQMSGFERSIFALDVPPDARVSLEVRGADVFVVAAGKEALLTGGALPPWVRQEEGELSRPGNLVTWGVDRVRLVIGDEAMQGIKQAAFSLREHLMRQKEAVTDESGEKAIAEDLGQTDLSEPQRIAHTDPEIGWPPAPLDPWVKPALSGEGEWNSLEGDPFIRKNEGLPMPFVTTYLRTDRSRKTVRVFVALWDPRQIELHMMAGTVEPKSATGEAGPGRIPRTPEVMKRVVAASNAGFQAMHGEFGMMADGVVYLPPKPYGATVAKLRDGSTAFGTWPNDPSVPDNVLSYRQNMTVMVEDEKFNPYGRTWWGGAVPGAEDKTHTVRTGICMTKEGFVAYFYGNELSPESLSQAMIQARCKFGLALDMNSGHSGLEFYKVAPSEELASLGRPLHTDWEAEGELQGMPGWKFLGRRLIRGMGLMNFPRYIRPEGRDFFYMTLRHLLPGPPLGSLSTPPKEGEGQWTLKGLPQHGFPYAMALTSLRPEPGKDLEARVLQLDPRAVTAELASADAKDRKVVAVFDAGKPGKSSLWHSAGAFSIADEAPVAGAVRLASGEAAGPAQASAAVGITDEGGMLVYVEAPSPIASSALLGVLKKAGASQALVLAAPLSFALGGDTDLAGKAVHAPKDGVRLVRAESPGAKRFFTDTPVVPFSTWYPLQQHRVRYFKKPAKAE